MPVYSPQIANMKDWRTRFINTVADLLPQGNMPNPPLGMQVTEPATWQGMGRNILDFMIPQPEDTMFGLAMPIRSSWNVSGDPLRIINRYSRSLPYGEELKNRFDWNFTGKIRPHSFDENAYSFQYAPKGGSIVDEPIIEGSSIFRPRIYFPEINNTIPKINENPNLLYRGMSQDEYQSILKNKLIGSQGDYNFSNQTGHTYFSDDPSTAHSYAGGFAPFHLAGTYEKPGVIIAIPKEYAPNRLNNYTNEYFFTGQQPADIIREAYDIIPQSASIGDIDLLLNKFTDAIRQGSARHWGADYKIRPK